ncbi:hypothetical protein [Candidatus Poriferisocius sp.]|uniref:hypothetical protein n=1 Tax=Candidatus Poriferisocius sp. TaxID=3101276 RepID=UPI003B01B4C1
MSTSDAAAKVISGQAWDEFCDALKAAGALVQERSTCDLDRIEGYRFLCRLLRGGLYSGFETGSGRFPVITTMPDQVKIGSDNPDAQYMSGSVDGRLHYRITGNRGTIHYLSFSAFTGNYGAGQDRLGRAGFIHGHDLILDGDGNYEIHVGPTRRGDVWLETAPEPTIIAVRQFYLDRVRETPATVSIECLDHDELPPPLSADKVAKVLASAVASVSGTATTFSGWVDDLGTHARNQLTLNVKPKRGAWGDPNQIFRHGAYDLAENEGLLIEFTPPECFYWNFQVDNRWMESLDYRHLPVTINKHTAHYEPDGSVRIVVAHTNPGFGNWMYTDGHRFGAIGLRWNQPTTDIEPKVTLITLNTSP